jgi:hypothetical protein
MQYDFFIAYASADRSQAEDLFWELGERDRSVFFDAGAIKPGARWDRVLIDAIDASRVIVVLVSPHSPKAQYQQDEVARAVKLARAEGSGRHVVPVLLPGATANHMPYGLSILQGCDSTQFGGLRRVAKILHDQFPPLDDQPPPRRLGYDQIGHVLRLDRTAQWSKIMEASHFTESNLFLFHGQVRQNVGLFVSRIEHFFTQQVNKPCTVRRVPFNIGGATPRTSSDWTSHLRAAFDCKGPLAAGLRRMAGSTDPHRGLLAVLCDGPLPASRLKPAHVDALGQFITEDLPVLLKAMNSPGDLSVLLTFDYEDEEPPLLAQAYEWGRKAEDSGALRFHPLPQASTPTWDEIRDYISGLQPRPTPERLNSMKKKFEEMVIQPNLTFDRLARFIEIDTMIGD